MGLNLFGKKEKDDIPVHPSLRKGHHPPDDVIQEMPLPQSTPTAQAWGDINIARLVREYGPKKIEGINKEIDFLQRKIVKLQEEADEVNRLLAALE